MLDLCFGYCNALNKSLYLSKSGFRFNSVVSGLNLDKSILEQNEVVLNYQDDGKVTSVPAKHGIITLFEINGEYFALGLPTVNPLADKPNELKASIGGMQEANITVSLFESLKNETSLETGNNLSLSEFDISTKYVCHRVPDWDEWSVCYLKVTAISKVSYTLEELKEKVALINQNAKSPYGIYKMDAIIEAAKKTAGLPEGSSHRHKSIMMNHYTSKSESFMIFDDNAIAKLFEHLSIDQLFTSNRAKLWESRKTSKV